MISVAHWWLFLAIGPAIYWLLPARVRAPALTLGSVALLATLAPWDLMSMAALAAAVFFAHEAAARDAPAGGRRNRIIAGLQRFGRSPIPVLVVLAYFFWAKYLPAILLAFSGRMSVLELVIPLGVSYFSFKLVHYSIERGRGAFPPHGFWDFASFMFLAPIFTAGPIERFEHFLEHRATRFHIDFLTEGLGRIAEGLVKKYVLGVVTLQLLETVTGGGGGGLAMLSRLETAATWEIWAFLMLSLVFVYFDFSAYSDIAIGSSRLFGLRIMENFNLPFIAKNLAEFWRRWHMTLAAWVRAYIYMTVIGLTRNPYISSVATFAVMGAWHALWPPHWVFWGLWHGAGLAMLVFYMRRRQLRKLKPRQGLAWRAATCTATMAWVGLGGAFTSLYGRAPLWDSFRIIAAAFGVA